MSAVWFIPVLLVALTGAVPDNMGFEVMDDEGLMPLNWILEGQGYSGYSDSVVVFSGDRSLRIEYTESGDLYGYVSQNIPFNYQGESIALSGYLRSRNMGNESYAGLSLDLYDVRGDAACTEYMYLEELQSDTDWQRFEITMDNSIFGDTLEFGVYLMGPGTVWVDDLELLLDGEPVSLAVERGLPDAQLDHEFDSGSSLEFTEVDDFQIESLVLLGKVWAFLKYHHPQIGRGDVNWDYSLMRILPSMLEASTESERQQVLLDLVNSLEPVVAADCYMPAPEEIRLSPDLSWIDSPEVGSSLVAALWSVYEGRYQGTHYYVRGTPYSTFSECEYEDMDIPDTGFRLLSLYRYWGIIEYFFPYLYAIDGDWDDALRTYIPVFTAADTPLSYQLALQKLIVSIGDSHASIWNEPDAMKEFYGNLFTPLSLSYVEDNWVVTGYAHESAVTSGIELGDVIVAIDGRPVIERTEELYPYGNGSTENSVYEMLDQKMLRGNAETVALTIQRGNDTQIVTMPRIEKEDLDRSMINQPAAGDGSYTLLDDETGYVYAAMLSKEDIEEMEEKLRYTSGLILDLRDYPRGFVIYDVADFILPGEVVFTHMTFPDHRNPGTFVWEEPLCAGGGNYSAYEGKVAILIDEGSISSAEFHAMAWRLAPRARVFGSPTAGADGNITHVSLPGGVNTFFTGLGVYNPDGSETQRVGIIPDVEVRPTIEGLQAGRDEVLEAALEWLHSEDPMQ
jgi:C-terminal processing protease CtpA/Prc